MAKEKHNDSFWLSYSDLMTSLFFIMLVLFIVCIAKMGKALNDTNASYEQLRRILQLETQFEELSRSSALQYVEEQKMFVAKDFIGIEIFNPFTGSNWEDATTIKQKYIQTVDSVGQSLLRVVKTLYEKNPDLNFQLIIEGNAAIPWQQLQNHSYNADNKRMYELSYHRALALYRQWILKGINLRNYNTEVIIAGSGFNGINRDEKVEENNKRFVIQIIPKISRPSK
ncbi:MAG: flagellar motor protein MotB [Paludibacteraceae bacterium]|nr:flagellar motor protein MotB [Paludibacteraceae bacterium]